jgi:hypothetical protein
MTASRACMVRPDVCRQARTYSLRLFHISVGAAFLVSPDVAGSVDSMQIVVL